MNIPIEIPKRVNPNIENPVSKSVVYYFTQNDMHADLDGNMLYRLPYSQDTYWTNFKYSYYGANGQQIDDIEIGLTLHTRDGYKYDITPSEKREGLIWYDTVWPIPSVKTDIGGVFIKVKPLICDNSNYNFKITLLGFMDLFPKTENYLLLSSMDTYQFVFTKYEYEGEQPNGAVYSVENCDYIREIMNKVCGIRLISRY